MKRRLLTLLVLLVAVAPLSYAAQVQGQESVTLNILVESGGFQLQEEVAKLFEAETGHKVNFVQVPYAGVYEKLVAEMATGGDAFDVATIDVIWIPAFAQFAEPLDNLFTDEVKADLFPSLVADAQYGGHYVGMPAWANAEILFYRKDLFEDPAEQAAFKEEYGYDLRPPTTWQEFIDVAVFFTRDTDGDGQIDLYGTDVKGAPAGADVEWFVHALQAGSPGAALDAEGNIIIDNEAHLKALQFYVDLHCKYHVSPPNVLEIDWSVAQELFYQGQTAMTRFWAHAYRLVPEDAPVAGMVGAAPMIAGEAGIAAVPGPWFNMVPVTSKNKEVAIEFVKFALEHNDLGMTAPLGLAASQAAYAKYVDEPGYEYVKPLMETLASPQTLGRPLLENWQEISDEVIVPLVQDALGCETSPDEALGWGRDMLEEILQ